MESLETKIERLPPELQKEAEDFIDFLIAKHNIPERTHASLGHEIPVPVETRSFPFFPQTEDPDLLPVPVPEAGSLMSVPESLAEVRPAGPIIMASDRGTTTKQKTPSHDDHLTRNYLDYGALADAEEEPRQQNRTVTVAKTGKKSGRPEKPVELDWV